jgi:uncharacterized protein (TIGR03086 family)
VSDSFEGIISRFVWASAGFEAKLTAVRPVQWAWPTPCTQWNVRQLASHMTRGNLSYARLADGGTGAEFMRLRDADALGANPADAYARSVRKCAAAFSRPGALQRVLDYPLGQVTGQQALAVRTTDSTIHAWDLAQAIGADDALDTGLVTWISSELRQIYAGLAETPIAAQTTHRFFAAPQNDSDHDAPPQDRLLRVMGRNPGRGH